MLQQNWFICSGEDRIRFRAHSTESNEKNNPGSAMPRCNSSGAAGRIVDQKRENWKMSWKMEYVCRCLRDMWRCPWAAMSWHRTNLFVCNYAAKCRKKNTSIYRSFYVIWNNIIAVQNSGTAINRYTCYAYIMLLISFNEQSMIIYCLLLWGGRVKKYEIDQPF